MLINNKDVPDNMYVVITYFFNLYLSMILFFGIINNRKEGPLNKAANIMEDVNIFLLLSINGNILSNLISGIKDIESNKNKSIHINIIKEENLAITSMFLDVK